MSEKPRRAGFFQMDLWRMTNCASKFCRYGRTRPYLARQSGAGGNLRQNRHCFKRRCGVFHRTMREAAGEWHALRGSEGRRARIPPRLPPWCRRTGRGADRRVFPGGCRQIARAAGAFREVFAMSVAPKEGSSSWRVLEPLDLRILPIWKRGSKSCSLRLQPAPTPEACRFRGRNRIVRWEITDPTERSQCWRCVPTELPFGRRPTVRRPA